MRPIIRPYTISAISAVQSNTLCVTISGPTTTFASWPKIPANGWTSGVLHVYIHSTNGAFGFAPSSRKTNRKPANAPQLCRQLYTILAIIIILPMNLHSLGTEVPAKTCDLSYKTYRSCSSRATNKNSKHNPPTITTRPLIPVGGVYLYNCSIGNTVANISYYS